MHREQLVHSSVRGKLRRLRVALRARLLGEALAWLAVALVGLVLVTLAFDYLLHLDRHQRGILMSLAVAGLAWVAWRELIAPLCVRLGPEDLALLIENRHRQLADRLISAVQFERRQCGDGGVSDAMVRQMAAEANEMVSLLDVGRIVERRELLRSVALGGCAIALLAGFALWRGDLVQLWFARNVAFADVPWPQKNYLVVEGGPDYAVLRGSDLSVSVLAEPGSIAPSHVTLHTRYRSVGMTQERIEPTAAGSGVYLKTFQAVSEPFEFYIIGGDDERDKRRPHRVSVIEPPDLNEVAFTVEYPAHMNRKPLSFNGGHGALGAPAGSVIALVAQANKDIESARMILNDRDVGPMRIEPAATSGSQASAPRRLVGTFAIDGVSRAEAMTLRFDLVDTDGYASRRGVQYLIQVTPDLSPTVSLGVEGVGGNVTPMAVLPLRMGAKDDSGIGKLRALIEVAGLDPQPDAIEAALPESVRREVDLREDMDLRSLGLTAGRIVRVRAEALDTLPPKLGGPNVAVSEAKAFRLVTPEELMGEIVRRQRELRMDFVEAVSLQESAAAKTATATPSLTGGAAAGDVLPQLRLSAQIQADVAARCAKVAEAMAAIVLEMRYNRLGDEAQYDSIAEGVITPLGELAEPMSQVLAALNETEDVRETQTLIAQVREIAAVQQTLLKHMEDILANMQKVESRQELANQLRVLIKWSEQLLENIEARQEEELTDVFAPATGPAETPAE